MAFSADFLAHSVCTLLWRRPSSNFDGRFWNGRIHPPEQAIEQLRATAIGFARSRWGTGLLFTAKRIVFVDYITVI